MFPRLPRSITRRARRVWRPVSGALPRSSSNEYTGGMTGRAKPAAASARPSVAGAKNFRWFGVNPFQSAPFAFSRSEFALTVMIRMTPPGASRPRSIRRSSSGIGRCAITDQSVTTSKPPAAISGTSAGAPKYARAPPGRVRGPLDRASDRSTPQASKPRWSASSMNNPAPQPKSSSRRPPPSANRSPKASMATA